MDNLKEKFIERTKQHIERVNKYAAKIGKSYPEHDSSKLDMLLDAYCLFMKPREELTKEEENALDMATLIHVTNSPHHPEYWTNTDLTGFTRVNFCPNGIVDATEMPEEQLEEMICDWQAMGEEYNNSAAEWFEKVNGTRWKFTEEQQKFILSIIDKTNN